MNKIAFRRKKGQISTTDLLFAVFIFLVVIIMISNTWTGALVSMDNMEKSFDIYHKTYLVSSRLVESPGWPKAWNHTSVEIIGLADVQNIINIEKFTELKILSSSNISEKLGVPDYKVYIKLLDMNNTFIDQAGWIPSNQTISGSITSHVIYNDTLSKLRVTLWR